MIIVIIISLINTGVPYFHATIIAIKCHNINATLTVWDCCIHDSTRLSKYEFVSRHS